MEWSKQSYDQVMAMPTKKFRDYLKWKKDYEDEKQKVLKAQLEEGKNK